MTARPNRIPEKELANFLDRTIHTPDEEWACALLRQDPNFSRVSVILGQIAHGASIEEVLGGCPDLEREDTEQALAYAAWLTQEEVRAS